MLVLPMHTAPKDRTRILVRASQGGWVEAYWEDSRKYRDGEDVPAHWATDYHCEWFGCLDPDAWSPITITEQEIKDELKYDPRTYDPAFIEEQLNPMLQKGWTTLEIASWFAKVGYEDGKMAILEYGLKRDKRSRFLEAALKQATKDKVVGPGLYGRIDILNKIYPGRIRYQQPFGNVTLETIGDDESDPELFQYLSEHKEDGS